MRPIAAIPGAKRPQLPEHPHTVTLGITPMSKQYGIGPYLERSDPNFQKTFKTS